MPAEVFSLTPHNARVNYAAILSQYNPDDLSGDDLATYTLAVQTALIMAPSDPAVTRLVDAFGRGKVQAWAEGADSLVPGLVPPVPPATSPPSGPPDTEPAGLAQFFADVDPKLLIGVSVAALVVPLILFIAWRMTR